MDNIIFSSATKLAQIIRDGDVTVEEIIEAHLQRIEEVNPKLNAIVQLTADLARSQAREADIAFSKKQVKGPLHGVPITVKDNIETSEVICTGGTSGRAYYRPKKDATIVKRMREAGAIILGKTNLPELGLAFETDNLVYGRTNNPYDLSLTPGGSSGGEAAIIAAGGSPLGLGNDMGGSLRLPAHFCGIASLKPTNGRVPLTGHFPWPSGLLDTLWTPGLMARFVEDLILTFPIIAGADKHDPLSVSMPLHDPKKVDIKNLRVAFYTNNGIMIPTADIVDMVEQTANVVADAGSSVKNSCPKCVEQSFEIFSGLMAADRGVGVQTLLRMVGTKEMHVWTSKLLKLHHNFDMTLTKLGNLIRKLIGFKRSFLSFMQEFDAIICPVCAFSAKLHGTTIAAKNIPAFSYTMTHNLTGWPCVVVRSGTSNEGLPLGIQIVARPWREDVALGLAQCIETLFGGWKPPSL